MTSTSAVMLFLAQKSSIFCDTSIIRAREASALHYKTKHYKIFKMKMITKAVDDWTLFTHFSNTSE